MAHLAGICLPHAHPQRSHPFLPLRQVESRSLQGVLYDPAVRLRSLLLEPVPPRMEYVESPGEPRPVRVERLLSELALHLRLRTPAHSHFSQASLVPTTRDDRDRLCYALGAGNDAVHAWRNDDSLSG